MLQMSIAVAGLFVLTACATAPSQAPAPAPTCEVSASDRAWIERALDAWRFSKREVLDINTTGDFRAVLFDADCVLSSGNALTDENGVGVTWTTTPHTGVITLPDGSEAPASVISFTTGDANQSYFVMSMPSVWSAAGVQSETIDLDAMLVFVFLHETSHVMHSSTYGQRISSIVERYGLPESFNDDSMQQRYRTNRDFTASVEREIALLVEAATAPDDNTALRLAQEARALMRARASRYFVGEDVHFAHAEDVWLTFEGSGQWAGYRWLIHPQGMGLDPELARREVMRSRWWSQNEGLAIALVLDRLGTEDWRITAFGGGERTFLQMLDETLAAAEAPR